MGKSALKHRKAQEAQKLQMLEQALKKNSSFHKNPIKVLTALRDGQITFKELPQDAVYAAIGRLFEEHYCNKYERMAFFKIALVLANTKAKKVLASLEVIKVIIQIAKHYKHKERAIDNWKPKTHNANRIISSLLRHIFTSYEVPVFMDQAFYEEHITQISWFIHIGKGRNLRTHRNLPFPLTKKMVHYFLKAPNGCSITQALRYAQIKVLGGNDQLANAVNATLLGNSFLNNEFWESVIRFFIKQPMLDLAQILPIVDYIQFVKYGSGRILHPQTGEIIQDATPEKPNFSMKGRTVDSLLRDVETWHNGLQKLNVYADWKAFDIPDFVYTEGTSENEKTYRITQLLSSDELKVEGRHMKHCVASYVYSCIRGRCSIWSMTVKDEKLKEVKRLVTIELNKNKSIVQVRGRLNSLPNQRTKSVIQKWMSRESLQAQKWAMEY